MATALRTVTTLPPPTSCRPVISFSSRAFLAANAFDGLDRPTFLGVLPEVQRVAFGVGEEEIVKAVVVDVDQAKAGVLASTVKQYDVVGTGDASLDKRRADIDGGGSAIRVVPLLDHVQDTVAVDIMHHAASESV